MEKAKIFALIKDKKSYNIQKSLFEFINNNNIAEKITRKEDVYKLVDNEIFELSDQLAKIFLIDTSIKFDIVSNINECFESLISKSFHNTFILAYESDDIKFNSLLNKIIETSINEKQTIEQFMKVDQLLECGQANDKTLILLKIINKFKNDIYHYQSARDKLTSINQLLFSIKDQFSEIELTNNKMLRRILSYILVKGKIYKIYSNLQFIKSFKQISSLNTEEHFFLNIVFNSVKRLNLKLSKHNTEKDNTDKNENIMKDSEDDNFSFHSLDFESKDQLFSTEISDSDILLNINTDKMRKDYFEGNFKDLDFVKYESMINDFKISLKLIESVKLLK